MIVILGAGLAGLSAAYHLKHGYILLEKESRIGGLCRTERFGGFSFDRSTHILYTKHPYAAQLIRHLLKQNIRTQTRESWVFSNGVFTLYPFQANTYGLPTEVVKECILGLIEAQYTDRFAGEPRNFKEWILKTFGEGIAKHFMIPYNQRVWAFDLEMMDFSRLADRVPVPDIADVLDGALRPSTKRHGTAAEFWYPQEGGIEALPQSFIAYLNDLRLEAEVVRVCVKEQKVVLKSGESCKYQKLISSLPLPHLVQMLDDAPENVQVAAKGLLANTIYTVNIGLKYTLDTDYHWVYFPEDKFAFHRISFPRNFSTYMAPRGKSSIMAEISHSPYKPVNPDHIVEDTIAGLKEAGFLKSQNDVEIAQTMVLNPAYIIYDLAHQRNVSMIIRYLKEHDIYSIGRFGEWEYLNMDYAILSGKRAAEHISKDRQ